MTGAPPRSGLKLLQRPKAVEASLWRRLRYEQQTRCRETLFNHYRGFARAIAKGEFRRRPAYGLDLADFEQLAYGGLLEAIDRFDPEHGAPFTAFARRRIHGAIADGIAKSSEAGAQFAHRRRTAAERLSSLRQDPTGSDHVAELAEIAAALAIGIIAESANVVEATPSSGLDAYETLAWREMQVSVLNAISRLPDAEKSVMQQHYLHGVSFVQIARLLGVSKSRVSQLHRSAVMRVREQLRRLD